MEEVRLPPGFRFEPTDEELVLHFLYRRANCLPCYPNIIPDLHLSDFDPLELNGNALSSDNKLYFYSPLTRTSCNNEFDNINIRVSTKNGYWKEVGQVEEAITTSYAGKKVVGLKKYLVFFHVGDYNHHHHQLVSGKQTNWVMEEYQLSDRFHKCSKRRKQQDVDRWVLCTVQGVKRSESRWYQLGYGQNHDQDYDDLSSMDEVFLSKEDDSEETSTLTH